MGTKKNEFTPMMKQYLAMKEEYKDCILMYRLGDFYEMFFDDALLASKVLEITLTGRNCGMEERAPMCGVPFHSVDSYISKLVQNGYNVAICEQTEDPSLAKELVERDVVRIVTPGTIMDSMALDDSKNNYLSVIYLEDAGIGVAFVDITTGELSATEFTGDDAKSAMFNELAKYDPREIVVNLECYENDKLIEEVKRRTGGFVRNFYNWAFEYNEAYKKAAEQLSESINELENKNLCICAVGALLFYLEETQKTDELSLSKIAVDRDDESLKLDVYSLRNLEICETMRDRKTKGSLFWVLNKTKTSMGARMMRRFITAPLTNCISIQNRHLAVDEFYRNPIMREEMTTELKGVRDIERIINKVAYKSANCLDLKALKESFSHFPQIKKSIENCSSKLLSRKASVFDCLEDLYKLINDTIVDEPPATIRNGGMIRNGANAELDRLRDIVTNGRGWLSDIVEAEKEKTGIKIMKLGYNKVFGYYIEVSKSNVDLVPDYFIRKQTLTTGERYITPEIKEIEDDILNADAKMLDLEFEIFTKVRDKVAESYDRIKKMADIIAELDVYSALAEVAEKNHYTMPKMTTKDRIAIKGGRHPVVEKLMVGKPFIPNDVTIDNGENQIVIITGPNMAGKSTYMRQVAIIVLMAQMGSFVPADDAEIGIVDKIFTRVGASDDLSAGESTFMVEMKEVAYILDHATDKSLIILDEIGRGTSTFDGLSIAWAVVEHIADRKKCGAKTLFATHYHELTELEDKVPNIKNFCVAVRKRGDDITFLRKIIRGGADESYGVEVAAIAGVKKSVIKRAKEIAAVLESRDQKQVSTAKINTGLKGNNIDNDQFNFLNITENKIVSELKEIDLNTLTPVEALNILYDLQAKAKND